MTRPENSMLRDVFLFQHKYGFEIGRSLEPGAQWMGLESQVVSEVAEYLNAAAQRLKVLDPTDVRTKRCQLMIEELGETLTAILCGDVVGVADGIADLNYVVLGTAVALGLPLQELHDEVHRSNMSKTPCGSHKPTKGEDFVEPDIIGVLKKLGLV